MKYLFIYILLLPSALWAAPSISSISGITANQNTIIISGTGFGTKSTAAPLISSYNSATSADNFSNGSIGSNWYTQDTGDKPILNNSSPRSSIPQSSYKISYDADGEYSVIGYNHSSREEVVYVSWWMYHDYATFNGSNANGNAKWMRLYTGTTSEEGGGNGQTFSNAWDSNTDFKRTYSVPEYAPSCSSWVLAYTGTNASQYSTSYFSTVFGDADQDNTMQEWVHWEIYNIYSSNLEDGNSTSYLLKNGETVYKATGVSLQTSSSADDQRNLRLGQVSGDRNSSQIEYIDQIYYDNTISHVFISETSTTTWPLVADITHTEVLVCSAWSTTSITAIVNQGSFSVGDTAYLYVVDADGAVNSTGYEIEITAEGSKLGGNSSFQLGGNSTITFK